jgi:hypothetical protein
MTPQMFARYKAAKLKEAPIEMASMRQGLEWKLGEAQGGMMSYGLGAKGREGDSEYYQKQFSYYRDQEQEKARKEHPEMFTVRGLDEQAKKAATQEREKLENALALATKTGDAVKLQGDYNEALKVLAGSTLPLAEAMQQATQWFSNMTGGKLKGLSNLTMSGNVVSGKDATGRNLMINVDLPRKLSPEEVTEVLAAIKEGLTKDVHKVRARG